MLRRVWLMLRILKLKRNVISKTILPLADYVRSRNTQPLYPLKPTRVSKSVCSSVVYLKFEFLKSSLLARVSSQEVTGMVSTCRDCLNWICCSILPMVLHASFLYIIVAGCAVWQHPVSPPLLSARSVAPSDPNTCTFFSASSGCPNCRIRVELHSCQIQFNSVCRWLLLCTAPLLKYWAHHQSSWTLRASVLKEIIWFQYVAVYCGVKQCGAVWCSVLQYVAVYNKGHEGRWVWICSALYCIGVSCSMLKCVHYGLQYVLSIDAMLPCA